MFLENHFVPLRILDRIVHLQKSLYNFRHSIPLVNSERMLQEEKTPSA